jgi:hypothetical protein
MTGSPFFGLFSGFALMAGLLLAVPLPVLAQGAPAEVRQIAGHQVGVIGDMGEQRLIVDGKALLEDGLIYLEDEVEIGGLKLLIGASGSGGNACEASPFVLVLAAGRPARLDGPADACFIGGHRLDGASLVFEGQPTPAAAGESLVWTVGEGFRPGVPVPWRVLPGKGWGDIAAAPVEHPADFYLYEPLAAEIDRMAGADRELVRRIFSGVGSAERVGDMIIASSFIATDTTEARALVIASPADRKLWLAWQDGTGRPRLQTVPEAQWPKPMLAALDRWRKEGVP